ncbi:hypothetical protein [Nocardia sp. N2S4-5]|uniref:hypothetical protein n=1 Tax=Nocardia sp. N2S4-5 TaxID=3351565 RepID=UPI0037D21773
MTDPASAAALPDHPDGPRHPAPLPPEPHLRAAMMYMLSAHDCQTGAVVYSFGTASDGTIGIKAYAVDKVAPLPTMHPYQRIAHALRLTAPIPLWGFGLAYDGLVSVDTGPDAHPTLEGQSGTRGMCAALLFDYTGNRRDLIRYHGTQQLTAVHTDADTNPYPPPGIHRYLWTAAVALDPTSTASPHRACPPQATNPTPHSPSDSATPKHSPAQPIPAPSAPSRPLRLPGNVAGRNPDPRNPLEGGAFRMFHDFDPEDDETGGEGKHGQ